MNIIFTLLEEAHAHTHCIMANFATRMRNIATEKNVLIAENKKKAEHSFCSDC